MSRILFLAAHRPGRSPGQRFRFEQYLSYLTENGFTCNISWLLSEKDDRYFYRKGYYFRKLWILLKTFYIRYKDIKRAENYGIVFLYREAVMIGTTWFERKLRKKSKKMILDFDDAIWLNDVSEGNRELRWLKRPRKIIEIIRLCDVVITGNRFLSAFALQYNSNTTIIPTTIDTSNLTTKTVTPEPKTICIGWTGSTTTLEHLKTALPVLKKIKEKYREKIRFRMIADIPLQQNEVEIEFKKWDISSEITDLLDFDIGIMPLPDNDWSRGKCGFKGLQYMALGIPAVLSDVGTNKEIIQDGINGFLAGSDKEWIEKLSALIEDAELRKKIGAEGRKTVEERYSFNAWKDKYLNIFLRLIKEI